MSPVTNTPCGTIRGLPCKNGTVYKGIRYARAERWSYPRIVTRWDGEYQAVRFGNCSYQPRCFRNESDMPEKAFYAHEFREGEYFRYDEDCLFLNIWVPEQAHNAPVLFYIHGGGFTGGCGHEKHFSGEAYCAQGVITVTINYRLGPLGFCCLPHLAQRDGRTGNYALFDQLTALQWIHDNIAAFGGDPGRVTLMGQSAGAMSVQLLCCSPLTAHLIHGAIMLSGGGVSMLLNTSRTAADCYAAGRALWQNTDAGSFEELLALPPDRLFDAFFKLKEANKKHAGQFAPVIDGTLLTRSPLDTAKDGGQLDIPYLLGSTGRDIVPPIVHKMAVDWALLQHKQRKKPGYVYFFSRHLPGDDNGAWHSSDLWYAFGTLDNCWRPFEKIDALLSDAMVRYLAAFVKTGAPDVKGLPQWTPITPGQRRVMCFDDKGIGMGRPGLLKLLWALTKKPVGY